MGWNRIRRIDSILNKIKFPSFVIRKGTYFLRRTAARNHMFYMLEYIFFVFSVVILPYMI